MALTGSGCSLVSTPDTPETPGGPDRPERDQATRTNGTEQTTDADPDTELVASLLQDLSLAHERVRVNRRAHRALAGPLRRLERLHAAHAAELGGLVAVAPGAVGAEKREKQVLGRIAAAEQALQRRLVRGSVNADSGALALLLAAMAAGLAQEGTRL